MHEAQGRRGLLSEVRLITGEPFAGRAVPVALPAGDNLGIHLALANAEAGSVLCIASAGRGLYGVFGELLMTAAQRRGILALVIDDGVRDLAALDPPPAIAARAVTARGTIKRRLLRPLGSPVALGGVLVASGDWLVGDTDGVCVVAASEVDSVVRQAHRRIDNEGGVRTKLERGERTVDVFGLPTEATASVS